MYCRFAAKSDSPRRDGQPFRNASQAVPARTSTSSVLELLLNLYIKESLRRVRHIGIVVHI
jgi:hypothetical protein